jgi:16S rRNA (guanine527-N7)-methyltransferase
VLVRAVESLPERSIEFGMSRGFAGLSKAILMTRKPFKNGGSYYHLKSEEWATEVAAIPSQLCSFWTPSLVGEYKLPIGNIKFAVVRTEKIAD